MLICPGAANATAAALQDHIVQGPCKSPQGGFYVEHLESAPMKQGLCEVHIVCGFCIVIH
jgi:hypothetical protein